MERLIADDPNNAKAISPLLGYAEVSGTPTHSHHRYVINFGDRTEEECRTLWPELVKIVEKKVKGTRGSHSTAPWWQFERLRGELYSAIAECERIRAAHGIAPGGYLPSELIPPHVSKAMHKG
jgi:hypothetical protein